MWWHHFLFIYFIFLLLFLHSHVEFSLFPVKLIKISCSCPIKLVKTIKFHFKVPLSRQPNYFQRVHQLSSYDKSDAISHSKNPAFDCLNFFQLWPENPTYQVYVPGYNPNVLRSATASIQQLQQQQQRAGSISPNTINALMTTTDNRVLYAELQFPVTSNYGSMKKRSQRDSVANTTASTR